MPHVNISMYPGSSAQDKQALARAVQEVLLNTGAAPAAISVRITEVSAEDWKEQVYEPYIRPAGEELYIPPGYDM